MGDETEGVYARAARLYWQKGWANPIPVERKFPPVAGYTGYEGRNVSWPDLQTWLIDHHGHWNIGLRMRADLVGIDVDAYDGKTGAESISRAQEALGPLPPTISLTARGPGQPARILLFRIPFGVSMRKAQTRFEKAYGEHVDILHKGHRYAMAWPSVHPDTGTVYEWYGLDGAALGLIPEPSMAAELPFSWLEFLREPDAETVGSVSLDPGNGHGNGQAVLSGDPFESASDHIWTMDDARNELRPYLIELGEAKDGSINTKLGRAATRIGHFITPEFWTEAQARSLLHAQLAKTVYDGRTWNADQQMTTAFTRAAGEWLAVRRGESREPSDDPEGSPDADGPAEPVSSWMALDLGPYLDGTHKPAEATMLPREDGVCLLYPGLVHSFHGESESGKSLFAQAECARLLRAGRDALYVDFESDANTVIPRFLAFGATPEQIKQGLVYIRPEVRPSASEADRAAYETLLSRPYGIAVLDGVTEGMGVFGVESSNNNDQVTLWVRYFPKKVAAVTGAAVVLIDHVTKATDSRGRFAIGAQAKMAALDGAGYLIEVRKALGRGMRGAISVRVGKDRPGAVRPHGGEFDARDRTQEIAYVVIDSTGDDGGIRVQVRAPVPELDVPKLAPLMEAISQYLEKRDKAMDGPATLREIIANVTGKRANVMPACNELAKTDHIRIDVGARNAHMHSFLKAYRIADQDQD